MNSGIEIVYIRGNADLEASGLFSLEACSPIVYRVGVDFSIECCKERERKTDCVHFYSATWLLRNRVLLFVESVITCAFLSLSLSLFTMHCWFPFRCCHWEFTRSQIKWLMMGTKWRLGRVYVILRLCRRRTTGLRGSERMDPSIYVRLNQKRRFRYGILWFRVTHFWEYFAKSWDHNKH